MESVKPGYIARQTGVTHATVLRWIRIGCLPYIKTPGGHYMIEKTTADKFIDSLKKGGKPSEWIGAS